MYNFSFNLSIFLHVHCRSRTKVSQSTLCCKILHINYRNICRVDCKNMPPINTHTQTCKLFMAKYPRCSGVSKSPHTLDTDRNRVYSLSEAAAPYRLSGAQHCSHCHNSTRGSQALQRIVGDQHLSAVSRCHSSLQLPPSM